MHSNPNFAPLNGREFPRFSGIKTFFRLPHVNIKSKKFEQVDIALVGAPFDGGVSYRPGARFAPEAIRSISSLGRGYHPDHQVHLFESKNICDAGDISVIPQDIKKTHRSIKNHVSKILNKKNIKNQTIKPIIIGGDHSTTIGSLEAIYEKFGQFGIIHFDAHTDTYPPAWGCDIHHGTFMRLGHERSWFEKNSVIQVGIRGPFSATEDIKIPKQYGYEVITADQINLDQNNLEKTKSVLEKKLSYNKLKTKNFYISFDIDCLDPAYAPGTGTPVPGGLSTFQAMQILRYLKEFNINMVGADLVEVNPSYDNASNISSLAAVNMIWEMMALM